MRRSLRVAMNEKASRTRINKKENDQTTNANKNYGAGTANMRVMTINLKN